MNWKIFDLKYDKQEQWAFEQMSYLLFCAELNNRIGLFRYKNQTGIETEPLEKDGLFYGFQAKYYTTSISQNKGDIIDSIKKAKSKNTKLNVLYLYINKEFSESTKTKDKKPQYQKDIEKAANIVGISLTWRVPSQLELQLSLPENKYIYDIFFNLEPNAGDLLDEILKHNENILRAIQTEIPFDDKQIKIDRSLIIDGIGNSFQKKQNVIISGEGGCGKTAIFKDFYNLNFKKIPICIFKATELNVNHINDLFRLEHNFTFAQFLDAYADESTKVFVVDSAEKLAELINNDILNHLIIRLKEAKWNIVFTTRYSYLNDLSFHIKENYQLKCDVIDITLISFDELETISKKFNFSLPANQKFIERLRNLFYLREYLAYYSNIDKQGNFKNFIELLWKKLIQNNLVVRDNIHIDRERCIISIAKERCETGRFYINAESLPQPALFQLKQDEILGYDEIHNGYFITHDIYEEWSLDKIVSRNYANYSDVRQFFNELGNSLPIRRAFRLWLSDQLFDNTKEIESFIQEAIINSEIIQFWKDEILVSVLLSDYSETFFKFFENEIIINDFKILKRIIFLLRIACTDISTFESIDIIKPKGKGWQVIISLIYKYKSDFFDNNLKLVLPLLTDWCNSTKTGTTTRYAGLLALSIIQKTETEKDFHIRDKAEENILKVVFNAANEIKSELKEIFDRVVANKWNRHNNPYEGLCSKILAKPYMALEVIKILPLSIIQLCDLFWQKSERENDDFGYHERDSMENKYGIVDEFRHDYFPASAHQTPVYWLLQNAFNETIDFIINFTNKAVESYRQSDYGRQDVIEVTLHLNEKEVTQYLCWAFWGMYRGIGSPVVPYLLQSIHMALEKILLEHSNLLKPEIVQPILLKLLNESKSTSLTSVVCSIILANSNKFYDVALILFKTIELFHLDTVRSTNEFHAKTQYSIGYGLNKIKDVLYTDERIKTCDDKHRSSNLESLFLNYQFMGVSGFTEEQNAEFIEKLYGIIDQHKSTISTGVKSKESTLEILLARMDRRNLKPKISKQEGDKFLIEFSPIELSEELREQSEQAQIQAKETFKYSFLRTWSDFIISGKNQNNNEKYKQYDNNPLLALAETKQLVEELKSGRKSIGVFDYSIPAHSCSKLMIEHSDKLSKEEIDFCKEVILSTSSRLFTDEYDYQISDGVEASIRAIPSLMKEYPDEKNDFISIMVLTLLDETPIGEYKRVCDYAIESIHKSKLWEKYPNSAQEILLGYIKFKPYYKNIIAKKRKEQGHWKRIPKSSILEELDKLVTFSNYTEISFDIDDIDFFDMHDFEIVYQLIPSNTKKESHLKIFKKSLPILAPQLLMDKRSYREEFGDKSHIYLKRLHIFKKFTDFILQREISEIDIFLKPFVDSFNASEESSQFIEQFIWAEEINNRYEQFWFVWNKLYPKVVEISANHRNYYLSNVIITYLLAWRYWREGIEEWHCLKKDNLAIYFNASKDLGHIPSVLYSITKVLNSIGSNFKNEGIDWIHTIVSNNSSLQLGDLESNTLFYLEQFTRRFIFMNRQQIREEIRLKNKIIPILDFMIERGSIHGYLLRESIL
ncbi:AVAST type 4 anti-phage nuclease Avs4 [Draconibacterium orientale]|uniref:AVAST type 4 anti-phage nuclease Avs4 n=1 Tax=Draconibacterium orientale TaxID=1168034 RepID=UPI002A0A7542|nr:AVAST type 4 anti-phage nuclease Avs4 [Draconibacterium orientale]